MHWIHCNVCAALPSKSPGVVFYIGSCGHPICEKCVPEDELMEVRSQRDVSGQCRVCHKNASYKPINRDLPRDVQIFFQSPWTLVEKQCKQLQAVMKFQAEQQVRFCNNVLAKQGQVHDQVQYLQRRAQVDAQVIEQRNREVETLKQQNSDLEMRLKRAVAESRAAQEKLNSTVDSQSTADSHASLVQRFGGGGMGRPQSARFTHGEPTMMMSMNATDSTNESSYSGRTPGTTRYRPSRKDPQMMETTTPSTNRGKSPFDLASRFNSFTPSTPSASNSGVSKPSTVVMKGKIATRGPLTRQGVKREGNV